MGSAAISVADSTMAGIASMSLMGANLPAGSRATNQPSYSGEHDQGVARSQ